MFVKEDKIVIDNENKIVHINNMKDIENIENSISKERMLLYKEFLIHFWDNISNDYNTKRIEYNKIFYMLLRNQTFEQDAYDLVVWMIIMNNDRLPDNIEVLFNEWILTKRL